MNPQLKKILDSIPKINPRMKELAEQADCTIDRMGYGEGNIEKFAELIVKECCSAADDWYQNHNDIHWDPSTHILQRFGLEP